MHRKIVFNFALCHGLSLLHTYKVTAHWRKHIEFHWPMGEVLMIE